MKNKPIYPEGLSTKATTLSVRYAVAAAGCGVVGAAFDVVGAAFDAAARGFLRSSGHPITRD